MIFLDPQPVCGKADPACCHDRPIASVWINWSVLKSVRSVRAAIGFDHGKMRETDFVAMPRIGAEKELTRSLLGRGGYGHFLLLRRAQFNGRNDMFSPASVTGRSDLPALLQSTHRRAVGPTELRGRLARGLWRRT